MQHLEGSGTPVLYIGRMVLKGYTVYYTDLAMPAINAISYLYEFLCSESQLEYKIF